MKIAYITKSFSRQSMKRIDEACEIIEEYSAQGYELTLRQLYYQFVARGLLENTVRSYNNLGSLISDARLAGLIDWEAICDRTRHLRATPHWESPQSIIESCASQFAVNKWADQPCCIEVWIEKDALIGVIEKTCEEYDVPYFSCRGYTSQSEMWSAARRLTDREDEGKETIILHLGDHDPSGIDMTRDIRDRLELFGSAVDVRRIALNEDQIEQYEPPPNPAKTTDSRFDGYEALYGPESWELDALEPAVLCDLVRGHVEEAMDRTAWDRAEHTETKARSQLGWIAENYVKIIRKSR